ncbi:hypothetical protein AB0D67_35995 [Streptosporangium sp. NPDC048047]|uniref:hypothetical protein n=1 Tax=unclassified Streptosporangium TaxID=2632669 RepID=UPI00343A163F
MDRRTARGNRLGLLIIGLLLTIAGAYALARGTRLLPQSWASATEPLISPATRAGFARNAPWSWGALSLAATLLALFGLRWLIVQGRSGRLRGIRLEHGPGGATDVRADTVTEAVAAEVRAHPAVHDVTAAMTGTSAHPAVRLRLTADETAPMSAICEQIGGVAVSHARYALEAEHVPAVARVNLAEPPRPRRTVA